MTDAARVVRLDLPWVSPPLSANGRHHWRVKARITREIRTTTAILARAANLPTGLDHVTVTLVYRPRDRRRRDAGNLMPTHKAALDGLVDTGLVPDDTPEFVAEMMPRIVEPGAPAMWLEIRCP